MTNSGLLTRSCGAYNVRISQTLILQNYPLQIKIQEIVGNLCTRTVANGCLCWSRSLGFDWIQWLDSRSICVISFSFQIVTHPLLRADAWLGVSLCVTKCSFQGGMRITRSIALSLLHFLLFFELVVVNNLIRNTSIFFFLPYHIYSMLN
jgi:hypothetical protein